MEIPVLYHVEDGVEERVSATLNLSLSGLRFASRRSLKEKDRLRMRLLVPGEIRPLLLHGVVRWVAPDASAKDRYQVGVVFETAEAPMRRTLKKVLQEKTHAEVQGR